MDGQPQAGEPAHGNAAKLRSFDAEAVEHADHVFAQIGQRPAAALGA